MKHLTALLLVVLLCLCLPGCQNSGSDDAWNEAVGATPQPSEAPEASEASLEEEDTTRKLVITEPLYYGDDDIVWLANEFMAKNKDVEITFEYEMDVNESMSLSQEEYDQRHENYLSQLKTKLMTGEAPDIIRGVSGLNLYAMSQSGVFQDLSEYWAGDMDPEDFFMPVLEAMQVDGKQSIVPYGFYSYVAYVNRRVTDGLGIDLAGRNSISAAEMIDWYNQAREQGLLDQDAPMFFGQEPDYQTTLYSYERGAFIDPTQREAHFDAPEVSAFLADLQALPQVDDFTYFSYAPYAPLTDELIRTRLTGEETKVQNYDDMGADGKFLDYVQQGKEGLFSIDNLSETTARTAADNPCEYVAGPYIVTDSKGQAQIIPYEEVAVSSSCKDPELAWEFIKYCISARDSLDMGGGNRYLGYNVLSINKTNCRLQLEKVKDTWGGQPGYANLSWFWAQDTDPQDIQSALDGLLDRPLINRAMYSVPGAADILDEFLNRQLTDAKECAAKLQDQAYVWLNE